MKLGGNRPPGDNRSQEAYGTNRHTEADYRASNFFFQSSKVLPINGRKDDNLVASNFMAGKLVNNLPIIGSALEATSGV